MATFIKGDTNILSVHDGTAYRPVACLTANSLASTLEVLETRTKCDPGVVITNAGAFAYSIGAEGLYIDTGVGGDITKASHDWLLIEQQAKNTLTWKLDTGLATNTAYYGTAVVTDLNLDSPTGSENATFSATLQGSGAIVTTDPIV